MKHKKIKNKKQMFAEKNIETIFNILQKRTLKIYDKVHILLIKNISQKFNIRLKREQKLLFCKKCNSYFDIKTRKIRFNKTLKTKEYICSNCGYIRRFRYK